MDDASLDGAVALITGASSAIGTATAKRLAGQGAAVSLVSQPSERSELVAGEIVRTGGHAVAVAGDITQEEGAYGVVQDTLERFGRLDILVHNASVMLLNSALHTTLEDWDQMIAHNITALLHVTHAAVPYLIDAAITSPRQVADLVAISSTAAREARPGSSVYTLTMVGVTGFSEALRQELLSEHVRVSVLQPDTVDTELMAEDVADAITYIVTRERRVAVDQMLVRAGEQLGTG